jgi:hypothetical protein
VQLPPIADPSEALLAWSREFTGGERDLARLDALHRRYEAACAGRIYVVITYQRPEGDEEWAARIPMLNERQGRHVDAHGRAAMSLARIKAKRHHSRTYYRNKRKKTKAKL